MKTIGDMVTFEQVSSNSSGEPAQAYRMVVPGGWIYYLKPSHREPCAVFVPDLNVGRAVEEAAFHAGFDAGLTEAADTTRAVLKCEETCVEGSTAHADAILELVGKKVTQC